MVSRDVWLHVLMSVLTCTRWLSLSATMIRLWLSHATPAGRSNWPGREPREPNLWWKAPQGLNIWRGKEQNIAHLFQFNVTTLYQLYCKALTLNSALKANPVLFLLMSSPSKANDICENHRVSSRKLWPYWHCVFMPFILLNAVQFLGNIYLFTLIP